jgi:hypothetical protein
VTGQPITLSSFPARCRSVAGDNLSGFRSGPSRRAVGNRVSCCVGVTQRALQVAERCNGGARTRPNGEVSKPREDARGTLLRNNRPTHSNLTKVWLHNRAGLDIESSRCAAQSCGQVRGGAREADDVDGDLVCFLLRLPASRDTKGSEGEASRQREPGQASAAESGGKGGELASSITPGRGYALRNSTTSDKHSHRWRSGYGSGWRDTASWCQRGVDPTVR